MSQKQPLGRLREALLPNTDVRSALLCTYGLDPRFFEAEILPALLPTRLSSDANSGSISAYLFEADEALAQTPVDVYYDHIMGEGMQLKLAYQQVDLRPRAFHPKLLVAEYDDRLRVIVGSANLTRPAWTSLFELFVVEDLLEGQPHGWAAGLRTFIGAIAASVHRQGAAATRILRCLERVGEAEPSTLHHSFDTRLFDAAFPPVQANAIAIVSPFFEGEDGAGVFDELEERYPTSPIRLFLAATKTETGYVVAGPPEKLQKLRADDCNELRLIEPLWAEVDDERAPEHRSLHGKLLAVATGDGHHVTVGSANATRAALLGKVREGGNAELVVTATLTSAALRNLLPASIKAPEGVVFAGGPEGEDEPPDSDAAKWVVSALFYANPGELRLELEPDAPKLVISYGGRSLGGTNGSHWTASMTFGADTYVTVDAGDGPAIVPIIVIDPERLTPRGGPDHLDLEALADLLAGRRNIVHGSGDHLMTQGLPGVGASGGSMFGKGAIPWRRILAALRGLEADLLAQLRSAEATAWTLSNPLRFGGLLDRFEAAHAGGRFLDGDLAFALHESETMLDTVCAAGTGPETAESLVLLEAAHTDVRRRLEDLVARADPGVRDQLAILNRTEAPR